MDPADAPHFLQSKLILWTLQLPNEERVVAATYALGQELKWAIGSLEFEII